MKTFLALLVIALTAVIVLPVAAQDSQPMTTGDVYFYNPDSNEPPGPPPNYNMIDSAYFQGVPDLPDPLSTNAGGYYIFNDTAEGKWYITNFLFSKGFDLEQFHGSILVTMEQEPAPFVNVWPQGFELTSDLEQNDRWGWIKWPETIAPNLYEIWWDITIDYASLKDTGDFRDTLGICVAGCAIDFNIWSSGHGDPFGYEYVYLGDDMVVLSDVTGFVDTYEDIFDPYQLTNPETEPNTSVFTRKTLPGKTYNKNGLLVPIDPYTATYGGSWAYEGNGIQFSTLFCPPVMPPNFVEPPYSTKNVVMCATGIVYDTIMATDPDPSDVLTITKIAGPGVLTSTPSVSPAYGYYQFEATTAGTYTAEFEVTDGTGGVDNMLMTYVVSVNVPPVVSLGPDVSYTMSAPAEVCIPYTITDDGNVILEELNSVGATIDTAANEVCFVPSAPGVYQLAVGVTDACGAMDADVVNVTVSFGDNTAPVANAGADQTVFLCDPGPICWPASCSDIDGNLVSCNLISSTGSYDGSEICFTPTAAGSYTFILRAEDSEGSIDADTAIITVVLNHIPVLSVPSSLTVYITEPGEVCFDVDASDPDGNLVSVASGSPGTYHASTGEVCFTAGDAGDYCMTITAIDACGSQTGKTVCVHVIFGTVADECIHVEIEEVEGAFQGQIRTVNVNLSGSDQQLGGFDLLIAYDESAITASDVRPGTLYDQCDWEYFTYRYGDNCGSCPAGMLHIVAIADDGSQPGEPECYMDGMVGSLAEIDFFVSNDRNLQCTFAPISFYWLDCGDNAFSSEAGDILWISRDVYTADGNIISSSDASFPGYLGAENACLINTDPDKPTAIKCVDFQNGGINIICADMIDDRGDINLNGVPYEIADAVMYSNYFINGLNSFDPHREGSIAASDINADGLCLSVADLVYLIRVVTGDAMQNPKTVPDGRYEAELNVKDGALSIVRSNTAVGAMFVMVKGEAHPTVHKDAAAMNLRYSFDGNYTRILVVDPSGKSSIGAGEVLTLNGSAEVMTVELSSWDGYVVTSKLGNLPDRIALMQNYPNPFNPTTLIEFALPEKTEWRLAVYNVKGQVIESWSGESEAGYVKIEWDASKYASGVYFYRLMAGEFGDTKKMVLLK